MFTKKQISIMQNNVEHILLMLEKEHGKTLNAARYVCDEIRITLQKLTIAERRCLPSKYSEISDFDVDEERLRQFGKGYLLNGKRTYNKFNSTEKRLAVALYLSQEKTRRDYGLIITPSDIGLKELFDHENLGKINFTNEQYALHDHMYTPVNSFLNPNSELFDFTFDDTEFRGERRNKDMRLEYILNIEENIIEGTYKIELTERLKGKNIKEKDLRNVTYSGVIYTTSGNGLYIRADTILRDDTLTLFSIGLNIESESFNRLVLLILDSPVSIPFNSNNQDNKTEDNTSNVIENKLNNNLIYLEQLYY